MIDIEKLKALHEVATAGPWQGYSEPDVGLPYSLFSGVPMQSSFGPVEPFTGAEVDLVAFLRNAVPEIIAQSERLARYEEALRMIIKNDQYSNVVDQYDGPLAEVARKALGDTQ